MLKATPDELVFVSQNSRDWCGNRTDKFHQDFVSELADEGIQPGRLTIVASLSEFNQRYTVSALPVERGAAEESAIDYRQILIDGTAQTATQLLFMVPDLLRKVDDTTTIFEVGVVGLGSPTNVRSDRPRTLDSERRLLQFKADYRVSIDIVLSTSEAQDWLKRISSSASVSMQQFLGDGLVRMYVTISVRVTFRMIQRGENTEEFSLAAAELINMPVPP